MFQHCLLGFVHSVDEQLMKTNLPKREQAQKYVGICQLLISV